ncbi:MAG TPA: divalent-cation tolerance protein CutA [Acidimicrobiia bacterium]|jgi:periplasmic divalent cation tolerance protein
MGEHALVLITCGSEDEARLIARDLVESALAAGVQIMPIQSVYRWAGEVVDDREWLLITKTRVDRYQSIEQRVGELHSYQVPPVSMVEIHSASRSYLDWIDEQVGPS